MKTKTTLTIIKRAALLLLLSILNPQLSTLAQGTAFTYQGRLNDGANPANGSYDLRFIVYDNGVGGSQQGPVLTNSAIAVSNGLFTATLDFGNQFPGAGRWLEIAVRTNGGGAFTPLASRQSLTPAPYAITSANLSGTLPASQLSGNLPGSLLSGTYGHPVTFNNPGNSFSGDGTGLANVNAAALGGLASSNFWQLGGNNVAAGQILGSTNSQPLELWVNGIRGWRLEPGVTDGNHSNVVNVVGGSSVNFAAPGVSGATISGGGARNYTGVAYTNSVASDFGVVGGGLNNTIQSNAAASVVGGGYVNAIQTGAGFSAIVGGENNTIQTNANNAFIGGGLFNKIQASAAGSFISGGSFNSILAGSSAIGGGNGNTIQTNAGNSVIGGGVGNVIQASFYTSGYGTIGGGKQNTNGGGYGTVGGGSGNTISSSADGSVIGGGVNNFIQNLDLDCVIGGGSDSRIENLADWATIGGGQQNSIQYDSIGATIAGGYQNTIMTNSSSATIAGGDNVMIGSNSYYSAIGGGFQNKISDNSFQSTIGGGTFNNIQSNSFDSTISGGSDNLIQAGANDSTIAGGTNNIIGTGAYFSMIGGGYQNSASGVAATVPGGAYNIAAGTLSFAAGDSAQAMHDNTFVWSDGDGVSSTGPGQFLIQAGGGVGIGTNSPAAALHVASISIGTPQVQITQMNPNDSTRLRMNVFDWPGSPFWEMDATPSATPELQFWFSGAAGARVRFDTSGNVFAAGNVTANGVLLTSDRNAKEHFAALDPQSVLVRVAALPVTEWNYKDDPDRKHVGPMAQDFHAAFGLDGADDKHISVVDEGGVALAAIQGLNQKLQAELAAQKQWAEAESADIAALKAKNDALEKRLEALERLLPRETADATATRGPGE